jgi:hypothetical protein
MYEAMSPSLDSLLFPPYPNYLYHPPSTIYGSRGNNACKEVVKHLLGQQIKILSNPKVELNSVKAGRQGKDSDNNRIDQDWAMILSLLLHLPYPKLLISPGMMTLYFVPICCYRFK